MTTWLLIVFPVLHTGMCPFNDQTGPSFFPSCPLIPYQCTYQTRKRSDKNCLSLNPKHDWGGGGTGTLTLNVCVSIFQSRKTSSKGTYKGGSRGQPREAYFFFLRETWLGYLRETWSVIYIQRDPWLSHLFPRENDTNRPKFAYLNDILLMHDT